MISSQCQKKDRVNIGGITIRILEYLIIILELILEKAAYRTGLSRVYNYYIDIIKTELKIFKPKSDSRLSISCYSEPFFDCLI